MVFVTYVSYPPESADDMAKRFLEAPQIPDFLNRRGPYFNSDLKNGVVGLSIWEVDKAKISEGSEFIGNYLAIFFGVPGFRYELKSFLEVDEALKLIGMG